MMNRPLTRCLGSLLMVLPSVTIAAEGSAAVVSAELRERCLTVLRQGLASEEFWPSMHAAEALSQAGFGAEVQPVLVALLPRETDDQRRCGLARELVRTGDLSYTQVLLDVLAGQNPHGHTHAAESLFKVWQIGDGVSLRQAMLQQDAPKTAMMAAAALARWGNRDALALVRRYAAGDDLAHAAIAAWILARIGDASDLPELGRGVARCSDPLQRAYFQHALAALGDAAGRVALIANLSSDNPAVRVYACEFAPDARVVEALADLERLLGDEVLDVRLRAAQACLLLSQPVDPTATQPFFRDVWQADAAHPRYSEGAISLLRDGRLLFAITEFQAQTSDFAPARIMAVESSDEGRTWGPPRELQGNVGTQNVMSVTIRRLASVPMSTATLGMFYLVKNSPQNMQVWLRTSQDDAVSFGPPILVTNAPGYHVLNNDRVTLLRTGRLVVPVATSTDVSAGQPFTCSCWWSDDGGLTWAVSRNSVAYERRGAMEPEILELESGRLLMHFRTQLGHIAVSESDDGGESWSTARSWGVRSPEAPATLRRIPSTGDLLLIWNDTYDPALSHGGKRTPLTMAYSRDEGATWVGKQALESDPAHTYAYTSCQFYRSRVLLTYYVADEATGRLSSRFRSLPISAIYATGP